MKHITEIYCTRVDGRLTFEYLVFNFSNLQCSQRAYKC